MTSVTPLRQLVDADPAAAAEAAAVQVRSARAEGRIEDVVDGLACLGRARRLLGEVDLAEAAFVEAIAIADAADRADLAADGHLGLAAVCWNQGRTDDVEPHLLIAERDGSPRTRAEVRLQRAGIAQLLGRFDEALDGYAAVIPELEATDARLELARVLSNRAVIHSNRAEAIKAIVDLERAAGLFTEVGMPFLGAQVTHNLGATFGRLGEFPRALQHLDRAAADLAALAHDAHDVEIARAQTLLAAGLVGDARTAVIELGERLRATGNAVRAAEVDLLAASVTRLDGDPNSAQVLAEGAADFFATQESLGWHRATRLEALLARVDQNPSRSDRDEIDGAAETLADECRPVGDVLTEIRARALQARVATDAARAGVAAAEVTDLARSLGTVEARLLDRAAAAAARCTAGDERGALAAAAGGMADLAAHRATLGSADARAHAATQASWLMDLGLSLAVDTNSTAEVLAWMGWRHGDLAEQGERSRRTPDAAGALEALRRAEAKAAAESRAGGTAPGTLAEVRAAEDAFRRVALRAEGSGRSRRPRLTTGSLRSAAGGRTVVVFDENAGRLVAVVLGPRRSRFVDVASLDELRRACRLAARSAAAMFGGAESVRTARRATFDAASGQLDALLGAGLGRVDGDLVLVPSATVADVPWGSLPSLADRAVTVVPSPSWVGTATSSPREREAVLVAAGPGLDHADAEVEQVATVWPHAQTLVGEEATTARVRDRLGTSAIAHLVAHGSFRSDNPLWSSIEFHDGPLSAYELESIDQLPETVVLSSCDTGRSGAGGPVGLLGLASTFLRLGVGHAVAAVAPVPDTPETGAAMVALHRHLKAGVAPAQALVHARASDRSGALSVVVCFGR